MRQFMPRLVEDLKDLPREKLDEALKGLMALIYGRTSLPSGGYSGIKVTILFGDMSKIKGFASQTCFKKIFLPRLESGLPNADKPYLYSNLYNDFLVSVLSSLHTIIKDR